MARQVRSFDELIQPSDFDYEGWLNELQRCAVKNSDMPKKKQLKISSLVGPKSPNNSGSPEEDSDPSSGFDIGPSRHRSKKRRYNDYTIQQLQEFIATYPCPDDNQKEEMARQVHLQPKQVTYWIQNYKTRRRAEFFRSEKDALKKEVAKLHTKLKRYEQAFATTTCLICGGPRISNKGLDCIPKVPNAGPTIERGKAPLDFPSVIQQTRKDFLHTKDGYDLVAKLVTVAMEELVMMAQPGTPLWICVRDSGHPNQHDILNKVEYLRIFPKNVNVTPTNFWPETTRESAMVLMDPINIVKILMDAKQWSTIFGNIVSKATTIEVLAVGDIENFNEALHEMTAEFHLPSPLVPVREHHFVRYCRQYYENLWGVVDVDINEIFKDSLAKSYRRPSGCLIQGLPNGYSKVTWVEHAEVHNDDDQNMYLPLIRSGTAFGAKRWVLTLERQCERLVSSMVISHDPISLGVIYDDKGKRGLYNLAWRMMLKFHSDINASATNHWSTSSECSGSDKIQSMVRVNMLDSGIPKGTIFSTVSSLWRPILPIHVFEFLRNLQTQYPWDILAKGDVVEEIMRIVTSPNPGNYISLLHIDGDKSRASKKLILQESCANSIESYLVYTKIKFFEMKAVLNGVDPNSVALLPSGFAIIPDGASTKEVGGSHQTNIDGTFLTIAIQKVVHLGRNLKNFNKPLNEAKKHVRTMIDSITRAALKDRDTQQFACLY